MFRKQYACMFRKEGMFTKEGRQVSTVCTGKRKVVMFGKKEINIQEGKEAWKVGLEKK